MHGASNWWGNREQWCYRDLLNSAARHYECIERGNQVDEESGLAHRAHMGCNTIMLWSVWLHATDDRNLELDRMDCVPTGAVAHLDIERPTIVMKLLRSAYEIILECAAGGAEREAMMTATRLVLESYR
jgi:hypothetical protein